jgi:hypothetical protein
MSEDNALPAGTMIPYAVVQAVVKAWPDQAVEILRDIRPDTLNGCWGFRRWGMYVGVEYDGYIHS